MPACVGCRCGARGRNLVNCLREMASASMLVLDIVHCISEIVRCGKHKQGVHKLHYVRVSRALALPCKDNCHT